MKKSKVALQICDGNKALRYSGKKFVLFCFVLFCFVLFVCCVVLCCCVVCLFVCFVLFCFFYLVCNFGFGVPLGAVTRFLGS